MMYISQLNNLVKHHLVLEYYERGIEGMCIKEFLPLCAALLYPYKNEKFPLENNLQGNVLPIIESVKSYTKKAKGLESYSLDGLRKYFQYKWLPTLDFGSQVRLIKGVSLIDEVENDGFFSLKGNEKVYDSYLQRVSVLDISGNYGNVAFEIPKEDTLSNEDVVIGNNGTNDYLGVNTPDSNDTALLTLLREFLLMNFSSGLKTNRYFWEYKLNNTQFNELKGILKDLNLGSNTRLLKIEIDGYGAVARIVALYISEWYKRECESLNGDRCLESVGLSSGHSGQVWKYSGLPDSVLHQQEEENQMRQIAMCALGGLPLQYVNKSKRFKEFVNGLFYIYQKEETTDEDVENVVNCFDDNNGVFKRSLESGSCKKYLIQLVQYLKSGDNSDLPFCESDLELPLFSEFIKQLQEGYDQELPKYFFTPELRIWTYDQFENDDESNGIESEFYVHIGLRKSNNVITNKELIKLGIILPADTNYFNIRIKVAFKDGREEIYKECRTYFKIGNGCNDFCGAYGSDIATVMDFYKVKDIILWLECGDYKKEIYKYSIPHCLELYSTDDYYLWTTKTNNTGQKVLFYDKSIYKPQKADDLEIQTKSDGDNNWGWLYQRGNISFDDNDGNIIDYNLVGTELIMVDFRTKGLRRDIVLTSDGRAQSVINGETSEPVHLLYYYNKQYLMLACDGEKDKQLTDNYDLYFKPLNEGRYTLWTKTNSPTQGFIKLRICCRDVSKKKRNWTGIVYFIPATGPIVSRNLVNNFIYFNGERICPKDDTLLQYFKQADNSFDYKFYDDSKCGLDSSTISFHIGDDDNHIVVDVYRAFKWKQVWNRAVLIKDVISDKNPPIANILQNNIRIKVVDENGCRVDVLQSSDYFDYFADPDVISKIFVHEPSAAYQHYIYMSRYEDESFGKVKVREIKIDDNVILLNVSEDYVKQYVFYYWSGELNDNPIMLDCRDYEKDKWKYVYEIPSPLKDKAVVFQSLKECMPNLYFRPFYDESWRWVLYVERYNRVDINYLIKCYQLASEHGVYFCVFPALRVLQNRDVFTEFFRIFIQHKKYHLSKNDLRDLTRLAQELAMDWFFVNRKKLFDKLDDESTQKIRECMRPLLIHSPIIRGSSYYSKEFIDKRFLKDSKKFNTSLRKLPGVFLKALDDFREYNGCDNIGKRIGFLNELIKTDDIFFKKIFES